MCAVAVTREPTAHHAPPCCFHLFGDTAVPLTAHDHSYILTYVAPSAARVVVLLSIPPSVLNHPPYLRPENDDENGKAETDRIGTGETATEGGTRTGTRRGLGGEACSRQTVSKNVGGEMFAENFWYGAGAADFPFFPVSLCVRRRHIARQCPLPAPTSVKTSTAAAAAAAAAGVPRRGEYAP